MNEPDLSQLTTAIIELKNEILRMAEKQEEMVEDVKKIKEELNIKSIKIVNDVNTLLTYKIKPNFALLSEKYGSHMEDIISFINQSDQNLMVADIKKNKKIEISTTSDKIEIFEEELIIEEIPKDNLCVNSNKEFKVGLDIQISEELKMEGMVRDLIRHVQNLRKKSNLDVSDRIYFGIKCNSEVINSIDKFKDYFKNETLIESIVEDVDSLDFTEKFKIDGIDVEISISKV